MGRRQHGTDDSHVIALAIDPATPATLYAGTDMRGLQVHRLRRHVGRPNTGLTSLDVHALAINPATPSTLYAGTYGGGVFKSTDSGGTWTAANRGLTNPNVKALAIDPSTPATLYAGTEVAGSSSPPTPAARGPPPTRV